MPSIETMLAVAAAGLLLSVSPGPSMLYVLSRSVGQSRAAGLASALGLGLGGVLLAVIAAFGLAVIFQQSELIYRGVTIAGALYIIYLGLQILWEEFQGGDQDEAELEKVERQGFFRIVYQGILVEALNPKTILFFMAFIPPFVDSTRGDVTTQMLILGALVPLTAVPSDLVVAFAGGSIAEWIRKNSTGASILTWIGGLVLIGIGASLFINRL
ncbi:MAG: LysE family translocator [Chloroflexota bacterium]